MSLSYSLNEFGWTLLLMMAKKWMRDQNKPTSIAIEVNSLFKEKQFFVHFADAWKFFLPGHKQQHVLKYDIFFCNRQSFFFISILNLKSFLYKWCVIKSFSFPKKIERLFFVSGRKKLDANRFFSHFELIPWIIDLRE